MKLLRGILSASLFMVLAGAWASRLEACSSCGSGGADPVVLNPSENRKLYLGLGQQFNFQDVDREGKIQKNFGPDQKQVFELALAQKLWTRTFASAVVGFGRNQRGSASEMQNGDASLNLRTTLIQASFAEPWLPQLQLMLSHRFALGRSVRQQQREYFLDVFGAGYDETYLGADLWFGMQKIVGGGSLIFGFPGEEGDELGTVKVGRMQRWIATAGYLFDEPFKIIGGMIHEQRSASRLDGVLQGESDRLSQDLFLTAETLHPERDNLRLSYSRKSALGQNKNASKADVVTLAWMKNL